MTEELGKKIEKIYSYGKFVGEIPSIFEGRSRVHIIFNGKIEELYNYCLTVLFQDNCGKDFWEITGLKKYRFSPSNPQKESTFYIE